MKELYFNKVVKKILNNKWKIINSEKIKKIISNILDSNYSDQKTYKIIYHLKNKWYIISLKKDLYYCKERSKDISIDEIVETHYRDILRDNCRKYLKSDWYIWWLKWLELTTNNFSVPEEIDIFNIIKQSKEVVLSWKYLNFKIYSSKGSTISKKFFKFTTKIKIWKFKFNVCCTELWILESLYSPDILSWNYAQELIKKILRKNKKYINFNIIDEIVSIWKHHSSINRLYHISKSIDQSISDNLWKIIKKHSFFLNNA